MRLAPVLIAAATIVGSGVRAKNGPDRRLPPGRGEWVEVYHGGGGY